MTKITPYTALCELFRQKVDPNNDVENQITGTEKHGNEVLLENNLKRPLTINNSCQTQPLRDYSVDKVMNMHQTFPKNEKKIAGIHAVNVALTDDNFQILRPDYAAYSGEKPYVENPPKKQEFSFKKITKKLQERPKEQSFTPFFNRNWRKRKIPEQKVNTPETVLKEPPPSKNRYKDELDVCPELNLYRHIPGTKQNIHEYTQDQIKPNQPKINSSLKNPRINAVYHTVSDLKTNFEKKYHHCPIDNAEKCLCDHCGALAVVNESLKRPVMYAHHQEDDDEGVSYKKRHRSHKRSKYDEKEFIKLTMKLKMMEERIQELEEMNCVQGPIKIRKSALTFDMYTQCGRKTKETRFAEPPECSRSFSPRRLYSKVCPFSFTLPSDLKDKIFRRKASEERESEDEDSDESDYKVKHISRAPQREKIPKPRLRCHDYINNKQKEINISPKKPLFWKSSKTYNVNLQCDEVPTKDVDVSIKNKQIHELLLELTQQNISKLPVPNNKTVRFGLDPKSNDTKVLYERKDNIVSSGSLLNKNINSGVFKSEIPSNETSQNNYFFEKTPEIIEEKVSSLPNKMPRKPNVYFPKKLKVKHEDIVESSNETFSQSSRKSMTEQQEEIFRVLRSMKLKNDYNALPLKVINKSQPSSILKPYSEEIKTLVESTTLSPATTSASTSASKSICQYVNKNFSNKTSTTFELNSSCDTVRNYKRSRSFSPVNKSSFDVETKIPIRNDTKRKKLTITLPNCKDIRPKSAQNNRSNTPTKNFIELNKNVDKYIRSPVRPKYDYISPHRSPYKCPPVSTQTINYNTDVIRKSKVNNMVNNSPRKKWNFSFLNIKTETDETKSNKKKIIKELSRISDSKSNVLNQIVVEPSTELNKISKTPSKETVKKKSSIFSVIKRYSKQLLPKRKPKPCPKIKPIEKPKTIIGPIKTTNINITNKQNKSKIPVYCHPNANKRKNSSSPTQHLTNNETKTSNIFKKKSEEKCDKICLFKPEMTDKKTKLSNDNVSSDVVSSYSTTNTDRCGEVNNQFEAIEKEDDPLKTLVLNSFDSIFQSRNSTMSNIIIFNQNLPIICEQTPNTVQKNNLSIQTTVLQNLMPSFFGNDNSRQIILLPAKDTNTNPNCTSCKNTVPNLNPPESKVTTKLPDKGTPSKTEKKDVTIDGKCSKTLRCKSSEKKIKEVVVTEKEQIKDPHPKEGNKTCACKTSPVNLPKSLGVLSSLRKNKNKAPKPGKCLKCTKGDDSKKTTKFQTKDECNSKTLALNPGKDQKLQKNKECKQAKCATSSCVSSKEKIPATSGDATKKQSKTGKNDKHVDKNDCSCTPVKQEDLLGPGETAKKKKNSTKSKGSICSSKCISTVKNTVSKQFLDKKGCSCAPIIQDSLLGPGEIPKKKKVPSKDRNSKCSLKCSSHTIKTPSEQFLQSDPKSKSVLDQKGCSCVPITQQDLLPPGEIAKPKKKPFKFGVGKCNLKCSSHSIKTPTEQFLKGDTTQEKTILDQKKCSCIPIAQDNLLGPGEIAKPKKKPSKFGGKCNLKCSSHSIKTPEEQFLKGDTTQEKTILDQKKCSCTPIAQDNLLGPGEIAKPKKKPSKFGVGKCNRKCSSHTIKIPKVQSLEKFLHGNSNKDQCKCVPITQDALLGPGETLKTKKKPVKSGAKKCNLKCSSKTVIPPLKSPTGSREMLQDTKKFPISKSSSSILVKSEIPLYNPNSSICEFKLPGYKKLFPGQGEGYKKIKCKRCAPQPPVTPKIKRIESNCSCDLSNLSISFDTDSPTSKHIKTKQTPKQPEPKNIQIPLKCQCLGPNSGKCVKCTGPKPIIEFRIPKKRIISSKKPSKCRCKPTSPFPSKEGRKKPSKTGVGKCNSERCSQQSLSGLFQEIKGSVPRASIIKINDGVKKKCTKKKVKIQKKVSANSKSSKLDVKKSPSKDIKQVDPTKKKNKTEVKSKSPSLSKKSSHISSCSICTECKEIISEHSLHQNNTVTCKKKRNICNLRQMKNKITSKFSCKYFKSLYRHPIFARASRCKSKEMRMRIRNFCCVSKNDFDKSDSPEHKDNNLLYGKTGVNSSVVNIYYNMQRFCFAPASDEVSFAEDDVRLTEGEKRDYLLEKLYFLQNFRDRTQVQDEGSTSNYGAFE